MPAPLHPSRRVSASLALSLLFGCQTAPLASGPDPLVAGPPRSEALPRPVVPAEPEPPRVVGTWRDFGRSVAGRPLRVFELPGAGPATLIFAGIHGSEPESTILAERLVALLSERPALAERRHVVIAPGVNPDGLHAGRRTSDHGVDLNRNFPAATWSARVPSVAYHPGPAPASEPETQAIISLVNRLRPEKIISIHSILRGRQCNNYDGPGAFLAAALAAHNGYPVKASIGYPTPGSFGSWAGVDRQIATLTLELPRGGDPEEIWRRNRPALLAAIHADTPGVVGR